MIGKAQTENSGQIEETTRVEKGPMPAGDIADAWFDEYSRPLTWDDLTSWLNETPKLTWADLTKWLGEAG
jgi:hypothetical protein